ncbi:hypothetical protein [Bradyrhizobium sp. BWA-3-5]|uniref:hypothetical protein n=1 Tax=Bradyrhizobium sp. BWA-3-5 TaxID=3080013 RepID=UPI00293F1625|nr:hypothetical protein [Bradyrhizobium sp. BWA-3-5]WOH63318.1 hypothetical protein RX331_21550 [Bradyrhizobium sp. BWA-3-5]
MNRFRLIMFAAGTAGVTIALFFSVTPTQAKQCSAQRPSNAQSYWSYRLIDGRKCWYEGKPMLSKSLLHWPTSQHTEANSRPSSEPQGAKPRNLLDAQASISGDAAKPKPPANPEIADASPMPGATLTSEDLRAWGQGKVAAIAAEPAAVMTILDRWPDQELPQHWAKLAPAGESVAMTPRAMMVAIIIFMGVMAMLIEVTFHRRPIRRW